MKKKYIIDVIIIIILLIGFHMEATYTIKGTVYSVNENEITFEDVSLFYDDKHHPIKLQNAKLESGEKCYVWIDPYFQLPPAANENLPIVKKIQLEFDREIAVFFTLKGNPEHLESLRIVGMPLSNPDDGQVSWFNNREYC